MERGKTALGVYPHRLSQYPRFSSFQTSVQVSAPLTEIAAQSWTAYVSKGDWVIDATAGNGYDTLTLARLVGPKGRVFAFDIQSEAFQQTDHRLRTAGQQSQVSLINADHSKLRDYIPSNAHSKISLICFNLGYLPGGNHSLTTHPQSTIAALNAAASIIAPNGAISLIAYRGHIGAMAEYEAICSFIQHKSLSVKEHLATGTNRPGPVWWLLQGVRLLK